MVTPPSRAGPGIRRGDVHVCRCWRTPHVQAPYRHAKNNDLYANKRGSKSAQRKNPVSCAHGHSHLHTLPKSGLHPERYPIALTPHPLANPRSSR